MQRFDSLTLSGGGIKGIGQLGALWYYWEKGQLSYEHLREVSGTSVGSIIGMLLLCSYSPMDIFTKVYTTSSFFGVENSMSLFDVFKNTTYGLLSVDSILEKIIPMVTDRLFVSPTFREFYNITGKKFYVTVTNDTRMRVEYMSVDTQPDMKVVDAVKMSCNLPGIFQRIHYNDDYYVDGGLLDNFPISKISEKCTRTLGIVATGSCSSVDENNFINYMYRLMVMPINMITELRIQMCRTYTQKNATIVHVSFDSVPLLDVSLSHRQKMSMFSTGYRSARLEDTKQHLYIAGWEYPCRLSTDDDDCDEIAWGLTDQIWDEMS